MADVVVTVPKNQWTHWLEEGDLALPLATPDRPTGWRGENEYGFVVPSRPQIEPGERVYVVAFNRVRGYAPLVRIDENIVKFGYERRWGPRRDNRVALVRRGGAVPMTIAQGVVGFQGFRYRWWDLEDEFQMRDWEVVQPHA